MKESKKTIHTKLSWVQQELKAPKGQDNDYGGFSYRSASDVLEAIKPLVKGYSLILNDEVVHIGDRYYIKATATLEGDEGSISSVAYAREVASKVKSDAAQLTGGASSYARKYALSGLFAIDDSKDDDTRPPSDAKPKTVVKPKEVKAIDWTSADARLLASAHEDYPDNPLVKEMGTFYKKHNTLTEAFRDILNDMSVESESKL